MIMPWKLFIQEEGGRLYGEMLCSEIIYLVNNMMILYRGNDFRFVREPV